jgi:hypothetical protein
MQQPSQAATYHILRLQIEAFISRPAVGTLEGVGVHCFNRSGNSTMQMDPIVNKFMKFNFHVTVHR